MLNKTGADFVFLVDVDNRTQYYYAFRDSSLPRSDPVPEEGAEYDQQGAMYFAVAVILIYGISIALLIGSTLRKRDFNDYEVKKFLKSYAQLDHQTKKTQKQKVRQKLIEQNLLSVLPECTVAASTSVLPAEYRPQVTVSETGDLTANASTTLQHTVLTIQADILEK